MAAKEPVRRVRLQKLATAYVQFAVRQRARFDLMWRSTLLDPDDREFRETKDRAFRIIDASVTGVDQFVETPSNPVFAPSVALWSLAHGFARLAIDGAFGQGDAAINHAIEILLPAVLRSADRSFRRIPNR